MVTRMLAAVTVLGLAACSAGAPTGPASGAGAADLSQGSSGTRLETRLAGSAAFPNASGKARFEVKSADESQLGIELEDGPAGTPVRFVLGGDAIGSGTTDAFGGARLRLNSREGDVVPAASAGESVAVTTADGTVIASGSF